MEIRTQIRDMRLKYESLGALLDYVAMPENQGVQIARTQHVIENPEEKRVFTDKRGYFIVDVELPYAPCFANRTNKLIEFIESIKEKEEPDNALMQIPISELDLSIRAYNCLDFAKVKSVEDLVQWTENDLMQIRSFGRTSVREVKRKLADMGLQLGMRKKD